MAAQYRLYLFLLVVLAHKTLSNPLPVNESVPVDVSGHLNETLPLAADLDDKGAVGFEYPINSAGDKITCETNEECTGSELGTESHCIGEYCQCNLGASQSPETKKCLIERNTLGSGCEEDWQCTKLLGHEVYCHNRQCSCRPEASVVNGKCWKQIPLGGQCKDNEECVGGKDSICSDNVCVCISSRVPHSDNAHCLPVAQGVGETCEETIQCSSDLGDGASCQDGACKCLTGYHSKNKACVKNLILEDKCDNIEGECFLEDSFGLSRVECLDTCQCRENFVPSKDRTKCLEKGQPDPGTGGAMIVSPILSTIVCVMLARLAAS